MMACVAPSMGSVGLGMRTVVLDGKFLCVSWGWGADLVGVVRRHLVRLARSCRPLRLRRLLLLLPRFGLLLRLRGKDLDRQMFDRGRMFGVSNHKMAIDFLGDILWTSDIYNLMVCMLEDIIQISQLRP